MPAQPPSDSSSKLVDVIVVGAGFGGMYMLHKLREQGFSARAFEQGGGVGGTWYWNRYPGARCDVESMQYSYSFSEELQNEWDWSEKYAPQPEILKYANHVADRFDLRRDIQFNTCVLSAEFNETANHWLVKTDDGAVHQSQFVVLATGCLSNARVPDIAGLGDFKGQVYHTGHWPHEEVDFTGLRVGVIGTGSSAIQSIPIIAAQAKQLTVFQRTANFSVPARNAMLTDADRQSVRAEYAELRRKAKWEMKNAIVTELSDKGALDDDAPTRDAKYQSRWDSGGITFNATYNNLALDKAANDTAADFIRARIADIVKDPATAKLLQPNDHPVGSKRICVDTDYFATYNLPHVKLVDIRHNPITCITAHGVTCNDTSYGFDALVLATGFDAMTGSVAKIDIRGRDGGTLNDKWAAGPRTYLGLMSAGFPNIFLITGPGSPSVLTNMIVSIEQHVEWIVDCLVAMRRDGIETIEATIEAEDKWVDHVNEVAHGTLYPTANSWYMGANIPGKPRIFMPYIGGAGIYRKICNDVAAKGYEGFVMGGAEAVRKVG